MDLVNKNILWLVVVYMKLDFVLPKDTQGQDIL